MAELTASEWDEFLSGKPEAHLLQTGAWGALKAGFGWQPVRLAVGGLGAQVLFRKLAPGLSLAYLPRGPVAAAAVNRPEWQALWGEIDQACRRRGAFVLKLEPDWWEDLDAPIQPPAGFRPGLQATQPPRTLVVDLSGDEDAILGRMKQKTRYNIRLAARRGVQIECSDDVESFHRLMLETGERDLFGVHSLEYYRSAHRLFAPSGACALLMAKYEGECVAGLMVFRGGPRAWYFYGASSNRHREHMPTYLLQWEAMRWARLQGCTAYDLWGVPDADEQALEAGFEQRADGLWGVYRFKRGFGGQLRRACGPWERVYNPLVYAAYRWWIGRQKPAGETGGGNGAH